MTRPLAGIRVLDMSRLLPGPYASLVLADLGAAVDKLEEPGVGDYLRVMPPQRAAEDGGGNAQSSIFLLLNRDKRSIVLDMKKPEAREVLLRMLPRYDVVLEQFRPGVLDRLGLGLAAMRAAGPSSSCARSPATDKTARSRSARARHRLRRARARSMRKVRATAAAHRAGRADCRHRRCLVDRDRGPLRARGARAHGGGATSTCRCSRRRLASRRCRSVSSEAASRHRPAAIR
ncbi:MAG: CoA transferase [Polyangiaceae bacterium]